jgi:hypothetical protein
VSQSRPRLGCFWGTLSPSRRQILSTRPSLTDQPAWRSGRQPFGILSAPRDIALRRAVLPERRTGAALGDMQIRSDMLDAGATTRGA